MDYGGHPSIQIHQDSKQKQVDSDRCGYKPSWDRAARENHFAPLGDNIRIGSAPVKKELFTKPGAIAEHIHIFSG